MMPVLPAMEPESKFFWTSGRDGVLRFLRCQSCRYFIHPPTSRCPKCLGGSVVPEAVSGRAHLASYTIIAGGGDDGGDAVVGWIVFPEQEDIRLTSRVVGVRADQVTIGMEVSVAFEKHEDVFLPVFRPLIEGSSRRDHPWSQEC